MAISLLLLVNYTGERSDVMPERAVGINFLEYNPHLRSSTSHASEVMKGIAKVFGGENTDIMPRLQRWERNTSIPLIERKLTLIEFSTFVDPDRPFLRELVLREVKNNEVQDEWERFDNAPRRDKESYVEAIYNRANKFTAGQNIRFSRKVCEHHASGILVNISTDWQSLASSIGQNSPGHTFAV